MIEKSVECPEELTYAEFIALDAFLFTGIDMLSRDYQLAQEGLYSEADWQQTVDLYAHWFRGNRFGRAWWDQEGRTFFPVEFATYLSKRLDGVPGRDSHAHWPEIRAKVTGEPPDARPGLCKSRAATR